MPKEEEIKLPSLDELFTTQEERDDAKLKKIYEIPISEIDPFPDHPFKVRDDEDMDNLVESIRAKGMITPCMVRKKQDGRYELISGHRRMHACEILGMDKIRCEVMNLSKKLSELGMSEAFVIAEKSNVQLQDLHLISEIKSAIKRRRLYSYLTSGIDEKEEKDGTGRTVTGNRAGESEDESNEDGVEGDGSEVDLGAPRLY